MEDHPIMLVFLIVVWGFYAAYYVIKAVVVISIGLYKWTAKKIQERQLSSLVGAKHL